jgi:hypothetical protein
MKGFLAWLLMMVCWEGLSQPEWQFFKPNEVVNIDGLVVKSNEVLLINSANNSATISKTDFSEWGLVLDDTTAISAMSVDFSNFNRLTVVFNQAVGEFSPGEIVTCYNSCEKLFSLVDDLGLDSNVHIDAINWEDNSAGPLYMLVSFAQDFTFGGDYYSRNHVYSIIFPNVVAPQLNPVPVTESNYFNIKENMNLVALDTAEFGGSFLEFHAVDTVFMREDDSVVFPAAFFERSSQDISNFFSDELIGESQGLAAMMTLDTGWVRWQKDAMNLEVMENAGFLDLLLQRLGGKEHYISLEIENMDGSAVQGVDYNMGPTTFDWQNGHNNDQSVNLDIIDNQLVDGDRVFTVSLVPGSDFALIAWDLTNQITVTVLDDDGDLIFKNGFE